MRNSSLTDWKLANRLLIPQELMLNRLAHHGRIELRGAGAIRLSEAGAQEDAVAGTICRLVELVLKAKK
jgi:hypothetical protein